VILYVREDERWVIERDREIRRRRTRRSKTGWLKARIQATTDAKLKAKLVEKLKRSIQSQRPVVARTISVLPLSGQGSHRLLNERGRLSNLSRQLTVSSGGLEFLDAGGCWALDDPGWGRAVCLLRSDGRIALCILL